MLECKIKTNIQIYSNIRTIFNTNIYWDSCSCEICYKKYLDIRSCNFFDADIFGYLFVSIFLQMSHSGLSTCTRCLTPLPPPQVPTRHQTVNLDSSEVYSSCLGMVVCIFGNFEHIFSSICFERTNV